MRRTHCQGCGKQLPAPSAHDHRRKWCSDYCRKQTLYSGTCEICGGPTNGYAGIGKAGKTCMDCQKIWTPDAIILAIREWADAHGGIPPSQLDWNPSHPNATDGQRAEAAQWRGRHPAHSTVQREFGSWNAGIEAAGFAPRYVHQSLETRRATVERYFAGERVVDLAAELGVTTNAIYLWINDPRFAGRAAA